MNAGASNDHRGATDELPETATDLGHHFRWLHTGDAAYAAMVAMIDGALETVDVEFYTVAPGAAAERLGEALQRAVLRQSASSIRYVDCTKPNS